MSTIAKQVAERQAEGGVSGAPERKQPEQVSSLSPAVEQQVLADYYEQTYRKFPDERVPTLGGMTPRAAARDPSMRQHLIAVMKTHLHGLDELKRDRGVAVDIGWLLDELGLPELK